MPAATPTTPATAAVTPKVAAADRTVAAVRDPGSPVSHNRDPVGRGRPLAASNPQTSRPQAPEPAEAAAGGPEFDRNSARLIVANAATAAAGCRGIDDPKGSARVSITFAPSGRVTSARVVEGPFQGTRTGGCIAAAFRSIYVAPFGGGPVVVTKEVTLR